MKSMRIVKEHVDTGRKVQIGDDYPATSRKQIDRVRRMRIRLAGIHEHGGWAVYAEPVAAELAPA